MLRVAIVGAGISGLTLAIFLRHLGFSVTVYERNAVLSEAGAGIQIPPNACSQLAKIPGLLNKLRAVAFEPKETLLRRYDNSDVLLTLPGAPKIEALFGFPDMGATPALVDVGPVRYLVVHRAQYQRVLYQTAIGLGAEVVFDARIVELDPEIPALKLSKAGNIAFDLVIGADGVNSFCRRLIASSLTEATSVVTSHRAYRALLPIEAVKLTEYGERLVQSHSVSVWLGPKRHIVAYPVSGNHLNLVLVHPGPAEIDSWDQTGSADEIRKIYSGFDPDLQRVLNQVTDFRAWKILETPTLRRWGTTNAKVMIIGDAAHAMVPYMAQGAAQAVEDAAVLANCLYMLEPALGLEGVLDSFETLRRSRVSRVIETSRENGRIWELEDGLAQEQRDRAWSAGAASRHCEEDSGLNRTRDVTAHEQKSDETEQQMETSSSNFRRWLWGSDVSAEVVVHVRNLGIEVSRAK